MRMIFLPPTFYLYLCIPAVILKNKLRYNFSIALYNEKYTNIRIREKIPLSILYKWYLINVLLKRLYFHFHK